MARESVGDGGAGRAGARGNGTGLGGLGKSEIEQLHRTFGSDLDICGLQIAVDNALLMRGFQASGDLTGVVESGLDGDWA
jgi:hypothetical protein